ncbi:MAG: hypothetical protein HFI75_04810 [Lachnospiraceae bacterium]|nr:hypothetical protein [Lachnospiraceae bacterium]
MKEIVELPINKNPYIHSNISRTSLFAVLTSEEYSGRRNAAVSRLLLAANEKQYDGFKNEFNVHLHHMQMEMDAEVMNVYSHPYTEHKSAYLYQTVDGGEKFCLEAGLDYVQDSNACSYVQLVVSKKGEILDEDSGEYKFADECSIKLFANGNLYFHPWEEDRDLFITKLKIEQTVVLKIEQDTHVTISCSCGPFYWEENLAAGTGPEGMIEAGLYIRPRINPFYYDFYPSHIQLCYTSDNKIIAPHFDYYERYFARQIPARQIPLSIVDISSKQVVDYFINLIEQNYYINLGVDEFYIPGRNDYQKRHHMHVNFLYGFDRTRKVFQLIGFDQFLKYSEIDFDSFYYAIQREVREGTKINLYQYSSRSDPEEFHLEAVCYMLKAYLHGYNSFAVSSTEIIVEDRNKPILYGLQIHKKICSDREHMSRFLRDIRIIYQIYEHSLIMKEMLIFMNHIHILPDGIYEGCMKLFDAVIQLSSVIKNVVLKNKVSPIENIEIKIKGLLTDLKQKEETAISYLLAGLESAGQSESGKEECL